MHHGCTKVIVSSVKKEIPETNIMKTKKQINQEKNKINCKKWYQKNKEKKKEQSRQYKLIPDNQEKRRVAYRKRWNTDTQFRLSHLTARALRRVFDNKGDGGWKRLTGSTGEELIEHFEQLFEPWMNWSNYGLWQVDHIKARALFRYNSIEDKEFKECWALKNLRPLETIKNLSNQPSR